MSRMSGKGLGVRIINPANSIYRFSFVVAAFGHGELIRIGVFAVASRYGYQATYGGIIEVHKGGTL